MIFYKFSVLIIFLFSISNTLAGLNKSFDRSITFTPTDSCKALTGISKLPISAGQTCDGTPRDVCGIFMDGSECVSTFMDNPNCFGSANNFLVNCYASTCPPEGPAGIEGVLACVADDASTMSCDCPIGTQSKFACSICGQAPQSTSVMKTACYCCGNVVSPEPTSTVRELTHEITL